MKYSLTFLVCLLQQLLLLQISLSQQPLTPKKVDEYASGDIRISVYFYDQLDWLQKEYAGFAASNDEQRWKAYDSMLLHSPVYAFIATASDGAVTSYVARGDAAKTNTSARYQLQIIEGNAVMDNLLAPVAVITKFGLQGEVFEQAKLMSRRPHKGQEAIRLFGMFSWVSRYADVKRVFNYFITADKSSLVNEYVKTRDEPRVEPLFSYQSCALDKVLSRTFKIAVNRTDQFGKPQKDIREERSDSLYLSAVDENNLLGVTALPYFSSIDTLLPTIRPDSFLVHTSKSYLKHYLKDIYIIRLPESGIVTAIGGTLLIHGYSANGRSVNEEIYRARLEQVGDCILPVKISYYYRDDISLAQPRLEIDVSYKMR